MSGAAHSATTARVVDAPHKGPDELDASGEELAEVRQEDQEHGDAEDSVDDGNHSTGRRGRRDVAVPWKRNKSLTYLQFTIYTTFQNTLSEITYSKSSMYY